METRAAPNIHGGAVRSCCACGRAVSARVRGAAVSVWACVSSAPCLCLSVCGCVGARVCARARVCLSSHTTSFNGFFTKGRYSALVSVIRSVRLCVSCLSIRVPMLLPPPTALVFAAYPLAPAGRRSIFRCWFLLGLRLRARRGGPTLGNYCRQQQQQLPLSARRPGFGRPTLRLVAPLRLAESPRGRVPVGADTSAGRYTPGGAAVFDQLESLQYVTGV